MSFSQCAELQITLYSPVYAAAFCHSKSMAINRKQVTMVRGFIDISEETLRDIENQTAG